jgi:hypothetical protein
MGGCPTSGCAQRGMVPLDIERPSDCPACGEPVPRDSYDCICGGRYHLECALEGCIRPACRLVGLPLGGRRKPINWLKGAHQISLVIVLASTVAILYLLLAEENPLAELSVPQLAAAGMTLVMAAFAAVETSKH